MMAVPTFVAQFDFDDQQMYLFFHAHVFEEGYSFYFSSSVPFWKD